MDGAHVALSRTVAHAVRHEPWVYELEPDDEGWVPVTALVTALREHRRRWAGLDRGDIAELDVCTAEQVGRRKASTPVILRVDAARATTDGVSFFRGNDHVWLADAVPGRFLEPLAG